MSAGTGVRRRARRHNAEAQWRAYHKRQKAIVSPDYYPKLWKMSQEGYLNSAIGRAFGVSGTTAGKLIRKYQAEAGL